MAKKQTERIPVTVTNFLNLIRNSSAFFKMLVITFFQMEEDVAIAEIDRIAQGIESDNPDGTPGKQDAIEGILHLKSALSKMTDGEKLFLRKKLQDPNTILAFMTPEEIARGTIELIGHERTSEMVTSILAEKDPELLYELIEEARKKKEDEDRKE